MHLEQICKNVDWIHGPKHHKANSRKAWNTPVE